MISGNFTFQEATDLSLLLRSGALPTPLIIVEERTVGPDLGGIIKSGVISLVVGFILVILFMLYKYQFLDLLRYSISCKFIDVNRSSYNFKGDINTRYCRYNFDGWYGCRCKCFDFEELEKN